jgi:hypothetical protein
MKLQNRVNTRTSDTLKEKYKELDRGIDLTNKTLKEIEEKLRDIKNRYDLDHNYHLGV